MNDTPIINKCKPSNGGNIGEAMQCLAKRVGDFAKELSRIERELEDLIHSEISDCNDKIEQESNRAIENENSLKEETTQINQDIQQESQNNSETFTNINNKIDKEVQDREEAIEEEKDRALQAEENLSNLITGEKNRALEAESDLQNSIGQEEIRAKDAERILQETISALSNSTDGNLSNILELHNNESNRAQEAERVNAAAISAETTRAQGVEQTNATNISNEIIRAKAAEKLIQDIIDIIESKIPNVASESNQLADKVYVNSSISTATAIYQGNKNLINDLSLTISASHTDIENALETLFTDQNVNNNDYCFVQIPTNDNTPLEIAITERYKFNGTKWLFEYVLNTSGTTASQWEALNSEITGLLVQKLIALPTNARLTEMLSELSNRITALEEALGGMKLQKITSTNYNNLQNKDSNTLYVIND